MEAVSSATSHYDVMFSFFNPQNSAGTRQPSEAYSNIIQSLSHSNQQRSSATDPSGGMSQRDNVSAPFVEYINGRKITISNSGEYNVNAQRGQALQKLNFSSDIDRQTFSQQLTQSELKTANLVEISSSEVSRLDRPVAIGGNMAAFSRIPGSPAESNAIAQTKVEDLLQMMQVEKELQYKYGDNIRLGYQSGSGWNVMRPGDMFYDDMKTGDEALQSLKQDMSQGLYRQDQFNKLFQQYGIQG